jgi:hypothetical protein
MSDTGWSAWLPINHMKQSKNREGASFSERSRWPALLCLDALLSPSWSCAVRAGVFAIVAVGCLMPLGAAQAHCFVGDRFLPATLVMDDPCVADELSLPTVSRFKTGDVPAATELDISADFSKRITRDFGITIGTGWTRVNPPGAPRATGFQNLDTSFQYQFVADAPRELAMSAGIIVDWGGTGSKSVGANSFNTITPTFYVGKGLGDLPETMGWIRPAAVTAEFGYSVPTTFSTGVADTGSASATAVSNPQFLLSGMTLQYSMPYLKSSVVDYDLPAFVNHLIPIVEASFATPMAHYAGTGLHTTGTINPGVIWVGTYGQFGLEAIVPVNRDSGTGVGVIAQLHLYLDDIFPRTIGRPLFGRPEPVSLSNLGN